MKGFYIIEIPRKEMKTPEDVRRIFGVDYLGDVITDGFLKEKEMRYD